MIRKGNNSYIGSDQRNTDIGSYEMPKHYLLREDDKYGYDWRPSFDNRYSIALGQSDNCSTL